MKWETDELGYPVGCEAFEDMDQPWKWNLIFKNKDGLKKESGKVRNERPAGCPLQDMDDGHGTEMWKTVEMYANDQELWIKDFVDVWSKMNVNGYNLSDLSQGPTGFWTHFGKAKNHCNLSSRICNIFKCDENFYNVH